MANKTPTKRVDILKDRNAKLSAQVAVQRQEINRLQRSLHDLQDEEELRQETVLCVNRLWEELNGSISFLSFRATGTLEAEENGSDGNGDADLLEEANPFLAKLLSTFLSDNRPATTSAKHLVEDLSQVENVLRKRMSATMEAATRVLEAVEEGRANKESGTPREGGSAAKESQLAAMNNLLKAENNRLRDQALTDASKIKDLERILADKEDELLVARRKIVQLKEAGPIKAVAGSAAATAVQNGPGGDAAATPQAQQTPAETGPGVDHYKGLLERRIADIEERDAALSKSERLVRELNAKLASERESAARARQYANDSAHHLGAEIDVLDARLRDAYRERDHLLGRLHDAQMDIDRGISAERRLSQLRGQLSHLEGQLGSVRVKRADAEAEIDRLRATLSTMHTAEELTIMVASLEKDVVSLKRSRDKYKIAASGAEAARARAAEATRALSESQATLEVVRKRLVAARVDADGWQAERKAAVEREEELRLFAEVSHMVLGAGDDTSSGGAVQQQISQFLESQVAVVTQRLESASAAALTEKNNKNREKEKELQSVVEGLEEERAVLTARIEVLQQEAEALRAEAASLRDDGEAMLKEVESVSEAYEAAQEQNSRLLASIGTRDDDNLRLLREAASATRDRSAMVEERDAAVVAARHAEDAAVAATTRAEELEARAAALSAELDKARKEARHLSAKTDAAVRDMVAAQAAVDAATRDAEAARKEAATRAAERDAEAEALRRERTRAQRAETDAADSLSRASRLERATSGQPGSGNELSAENAALRKMLNCNVCHTRLKDRIITKCNHIFCSHCIDANLATRHRKCPGCGEKFSASDVKQFFFT